MNSAQSIATLYKIIEEMHGSIEAKNAASDMIFNVLSDLHEKGLPVTEDNITTHFAQYTGDYVEASKT